MSGHEPFLSLITYEKPAESTIFAIIWQKSMRHFTPKHPFDFKIRPVECPFHGTDRFQSRTESVATSRNAPKRRLLRVIIFRGFNSLPHSAQPVTPPPATAAAACTARERQKRS